METMTVEELRAAQKKPRPHWTTFARGKRKQRGEMNKLETEFANHLRYQMAAGDVLWWSYESITLTLSHGAKGGAEGSRLTVDFFVMTRDGTLCCYEVKGFKNDRQCNALKMAAELYPIQFFLAEKRPKSAGGGWTFTEY